MGSACASESDAATGMTPEAEARVRGLEWLRGVGRRLLAIPFPLSALPFLSWAGLIWWLSSQEQLDPGPLVPGVPLLANLAHAFEFGMLALWLVLVLPRAAGPAGRTGWPGLGPRSAALAFFPLIAYALLDEWHQSSVPHRNASLLDVVTDAVGILSVLWVVAYLGRDDAHESGLRRRLLVGLLACVGAAGLATAYGRTYGLGPWPW